MAKNKMVSRELIEYLAGFTHDPAGFVWAAFPWGEGPLENMRPSEWQLELMNDIRDGLKTPGEVVREAVASGHGIGKALSNDTVLDTPTGRRLWGDIRPGDYVFSSDGQPTRVMACRRYESLPIYRVVFDDDSSTEVSSGHLWAVRGRKERRKGTNGWRLMTTQGILNAGARRANGERKARQWEIPMQGAVEFEKKPVPVPPYILGVWLGDGTTGKAAYTKPDEEIKEHIESMGYEITEEKTGYSHYIRGIKTDFMKLGVFRRNSCHRYIPKGYKYNDIDSRKELLCGLMDSDGEVNKEHSVMYDTTSKQLADDVVWLVRSLGGKAQIQPTVKKGWYYDEQGNRVEGKDCWRVTMNLPFNPFRLKRRRERYKADIQHRYKCRWIDRIEYVGKKPGQCIQVESWDGLYLANDFIVTHNSALVSWLILWAVTTHEDTRGVVTANTDTQLKSKTWSELATWYNRFIAKDLFVYTATSLFSAVAGHEKTWRVDAIPWSERNTEAFAGLHNHGKRILVIFDEASAIADKIWEVTEGAMTDSDTEILWIAFGNPTRTNGRFYDCFHRARKAWHTKQIDSRSVPISNKKEIEKWRETWGEDSDFFKIRVRGEFPSASVSQFISQDIIDTAVERRLTWKEKIQREPVIIGVDPAWTGEDSLEIFLRQGVYSEHLATYPKNDDDGHMAGIIAKLEDERNAKAVFIDQGYGTGIYSFGRSMGRHWRLVPFSGKPTDSYYANKRAEMWAAMKKWLQEGGCIEDDRELLDDLAGPEAFMNNSGKLQLESKDDMKKRGLASPNKGDALALTFAYPVIPDGVGMATGQCRTEYDPFGGR